MSLLKEMWGCEEKCDGARRRLTITSNENKKSSSAERRNETLVSVL